MNPTFAAVSRLVDFLGIIEGEVYEEAPSPIHDQITEVAIEKLYADYPVPSRATILDVGCGQGVALRHFVARGAVPTGISLYDADLAVCAREGYRVLKMDQSFLEFEDASFDLVWARHVVEHSIMPYFTLFGINRVLKPGGILYLEVPGAETSCSHERNRNHYSVMGKSMWNELIERSGFTIQEVQDYFFKTAAGPDQYWGFFCTSKRGLR